MTINEIEKQIEKLKEKDHLPDIAKLIEELERRWDKLKAKLKHTNGSNGKAG